MTEAEIIKALRTAKSLPRDALRAGVKNASALEEPVLELAQKLRDGVYLLPDEEQLFFYGVHILAAARNRKLYPILLELAEGHERKLQQIFGDHITYALTRLLVSAYDGNEIQLFDLLKRREMTESIRWALFGVLTRLTWEGRIERDHTIDFLKQFAETKLANKDDMVWFGWEDAVVYLGVTDLEPALKSVWQKKTFEHRNDLDKQEALEILHAAAANPEDEQPLIIDGLVPIDDPVEALYWVERMEELINEHTDLGPDNDPAKSVRLSDSELDWLAGFLMSEQVPDTTMNLEMLDGYFAALVVGPETIMPSEYMPEIWGEDSEEVSYDSMEQAEYVIGILMRHWNTIAQRISAGHPHELIIVPYGDEDRGRDWARGFVVGTALRFDAWDALLEDEELNILIPSIMALIQDDADIFEDRVTPEFRADILESIPLMLQTIAQFWRHQTRSPRQPLRNTKIGRNQPCPCGSGKKYKRCCGSAVPPTVH